jgi:hypothetical protein
MVADASDIGLENIRSPRRGNGRAATPSNRAGVFASGAARFAIAGMLEPWDEPPLAMCSTVELIDCHISREPTTAAVVAARPEAAIRIAKWRILG